MAVMNLDMTLRDFFAMCDRVGDALRVLNESRAMMGPAIPRNTQVLREVGNVIEYAGDPPPLAERRDHRPTVSNKPVEWSPQELAQREKMRVEREMAVLEQMPDDVKRAVAKP